MLTMPNLSCTVLYMNNTTNTTPAHNYTTAMVELKRNARARITNLVTWDAGDGFIGRGYFCDQRNRIITECITPTGVVMH